jgi:hypothetical protein
MRSVQSFVEPHIPPAYSPAAGAADELGMFIARDYRNAQSVAAGQ